MTLMSISQKTASLIKVEPLMTRIGLTITMDISTTYSKVQGANNESKDNYNEA